MGIFRKALLSTTALGAGVSYLISTNYIYVGQYIEEPPYQRSQKSLTTKFKHYLGFDTGDDVSLSKSYKLANPLNNPSAYDYFEKRMTAEETKKFFAKFKTEEERIAILQKHVLLGPTLMFHRFIISPYFQYYRNGARMSACSAFEPELKTVEPTPAFTFPQPIFPSTIESYPQSSKTPYAWSAEDIAPLTKPLPRSTIVYGMFSVLDYGKRSSNGSYFDFSFGGDLIVASMVHRVEYYTVKDEKSEDNLVVRLTNVAQLSFPDAPKFTDDTNGLHELMTRTMVLDVVRGIKSEIRG